MKLLIVFVIGAIVGFSLGNTAGDEATLRECATKGEAAMMGGGIITCKVKPEP